METLRSEAASALPYVAAKRTATVDHEMTYNKPAIFEFPAHSISPFDLFFELDLMPYSLDLMPYSVMIGMLKQQLFP